MPEQKILSVHLPRDKMHSKMFKATVYEIFRLDGLGTRTVGGKRRTGMTIELFISSVVLGFLLGILLWSRKNGHSVKQPEQISHIHWD